MKFIKKFKNKEADNKNALIVFVGQ